MSGLFNDDTLSLYLKLKEAMKQYVRDAMPGGALSPEYGKPSSVMENYRHPMGGGKYINTEEPLGPPTVGPLSLDPTDYIGPKTLANIGLMAKAAIGPAMLGGLLATSKNSVPSMMRQSGQIAWHGSPHKFPPVRELLMPDGTKLIQDLTQSTHLPEGAKVIAEHPFGKFDLSKIGSGEGAQAYGHGLYLAEAPGVAKQYADTLSSYHIATKDGVKGGGDFADALVANAGEYPSSLSSAIRSQANKIATDLANGKPAEQIVSAMRNGPYARIYSGLADAVENLSPSKAVGSLYKVDIPDEAVARFLDWDKPLSEQANVLGSLLSDVNSINTVSAQKIRNLADSPGLADWAKSDLLKDAAEVERSNSPAHIAGVLKRMQMEYGITPDHGPFKDQAQSFLDFVKGMQAVPNMDTGGGAVSYLNARYGQTKASDLMRDAGIPGIRYLDGGSRGAGSGTSNFVVFDPDMIRILERNGEATGAKPWQPGEWEGLFKK